MDLLKPSSLRQIFFLVLKRQKYAFSESINRSNQGKVHTDIHMHTVQRAESTRGVKVFSRCVCVYARRHAHGQSRPPFVMPWTVAFQVALSMGFSRQEYWSGVTFPSPGDFPDWGIEPASPALQTGSLPTKLGSPQGRFAVRLIKHKFQTYFPYLHMLLRKTLAIVWS